MPSRNETFSFHYIFPEERLADWARDSKLQIVVKDWDLLGDADFVGSCHVPAGDLSLASRHKIKPVVLCPIGHDSVELPLLDSEGKAVKARDGVAAMLDVRIRLLDRPPPPLPAIVRVSILKARSLIAMDRGGTSDPYAVATLSSLGPKDKKARTRVVSKDLHPVWNEVFDLESRDIFNDSLTLSVFDKDLLSDDVIGNVTLGLKDLLHQGVSSFQQMKHLGTSDATWHQLLQASKKREKPKVAGEVELKIELLRPPSPSEFREWLLTVVICRARGLTAKDRGGTSDPYAVLACGQQKQKTKVVAKNLNPTWDEKFVMIIKAVGMRPVEPVVLSVWDKDLIGTDDAIGETTLDLEHILSTILPPQADPDDPEARSAAHAMPSHSQRHKSWIPIFENAAQVQQSGEVLLEISATERLVFRPDEAGNLSVTSGEALARLHHGAFFELLDEHGNAVFGTAEQGGQQPGPSVAHIQVRVTYCRGGNGRVGGGQWLWWPWWWLSPPDYKVLIVWGRAGAAPRRGRCPPFRGGSPS